MGDNNFIIELLKNIFTTDELISQCDRLEHMESISDKKSETYIDLETHKQKDNDRFNDYIKDNKEALIKLLSTIENLEVKSHNVTSLMENQLDYKQSMDKYKCFITFNSSYSKFGKEDMLNQWRDTGAFMHNVGSIETLVEFYMNIMCCYNSSILDDTNEWYCKLPKEWESIIKSASISSTKKDEFKKYGIKITNKNIGEFVDYKYYAGSEYEKDKYTPEYEKSIKQFGKNGGSLLETKFSDKITSNLNLKISPTETTDDVSYVAKNLFSLSENKERRLPIGEAFFDNPAFKKGTCYYPERSIKSNRPINTAYLISDTSYKCSMDPGRLHEDITIPLMGINSTKDNDPAKKSESAYITCNRFRLLSDIIFGAPHG
jgi:hypothetical protein